MGSLCRRVVPTGGYFATLSCSGPCIGTADRTVGAPPPNFDADKRGVVFISNNLVIVGLAVLGSAMHRSDADDRRLPVRKDSGLAMPRWRPRVHRVLVGDPPPRATSRPGSALAPLRPSTEQVRGLGRIRGTSGAAKLVCPATAIRRFWRPKTSASASARSRRSRTSTSTCSAGEVVAIVGDNGAGKSTLIKAIAGHPAGRRRAHVLQGPGGQDLSLPATPPRSGIATVYQDLALCDNLDVVANLFLGQEDR